MIYVLSPNKKMVIYESESNDNLKENTETLLQFLDLPINFENLIISNNKPIQCENLLDYKYIKNLLLDISTTGSGEGYLSKYAWSTKSKFKKKNKKKGIYKPFTEIIKEEKGEKGCLCDLYNDMLTKNGFSVNDGGKIKTYHKKYMKDRNLNIYFTDKIQISITTDSGKSLFSHEYVPNGEFEKTKNYLKTKISQLMRAADVN